MKNQEPENDRKTANELAFTEYVWQFESVTEFHDAIDRGDFHDFVQSMDLGELVRIIEYGTESIYEDAEDYIENMIQQRHPVFYGEAQLEERRDYQSRYNDMKGLLFPD